MKDGHKSDGIPSGIPEKKSEAKKPAKTTDLPDNQFIGPDGKKYWKNGNAAVKEL